jgi:SPX domain protein involved in polyphosphate accumulation
VCVCVCGCGRRVQYYDVNNVAIDMYMQRHSDRDTLGDVRPIQLHYSSYCRNFFVFENDTWDIQADDIQQTDGASRLRLRWWRSLRWLAGWPAGRFVLTWAQCTTI